MSAAPKTLTEIESNLLLRQLFNCPPEDAKNLIGLRNITMALFMLDAGLRVSEVCGLMISDVVVGAKLVEAVFIRAEIAKRGITRTIPLSARLKTYLKPYICLFRILVRQSKVPFLFYTRKSGIRITTRQVERIIATAGKKATGRDVWPHMLRHTFATKVMRTSSTAIVQELLGHKNLSSTQVYLNPDMQDLHSAIENMNGVKS